MKKAPLRGCVRYRKGLCARRIFLPQAGLKKPRSALGSFAARAPNPVQPQYITAVSESHLPDSSLRRKTSGAGLLPASGGRPHQGKSFSREIFLPAGSTGNTQIKNGRTAQKRGVDAADKRQAVGSPDQIRPPDRLLTERGLPHGYIFRSDPDRCFDRRNDCPVHAGQ